MRAARHIPFVLLVAAALLLPGRAAAQIDALIDAVVDAVEPTPVYDSGLREATENLASKIDRLNRVLFGGAEETSAAYRYTTMYGDLYDLTTALTTYVDRSYGNAHRLARTYESLGGAGASLHDYAYAVEDTWHSYNNAVRQGSSIVARFKALFADPNVTNAEVRAAARSAVAELERDQAEEGRRAERELSATEVAAGLVECASLLGSAPQEYVSAGRQTYGTTISEGGSATATGTLGTSVMIIIGLLCIIYGAFTGIHIMKGSGHAEEMIARLLFFFVFSLIIILAIQASI